MKVITITGKEAALYPNMQMIGYASNGESAEFFGEKYLLKGYIQLKKSYDDWSIKSITYLEDDFSVFVLKSEYYKYHCKLKDIL